MARRLPGTPPVLPGYTHVRALGTGGFADVFLYEQAMPRRTIAVKVLLTDAVQGDLRTAFLQETNTLAHLATHPHVLTMYEAGISSDGRPYLVTEFCPRGFGERFRTERISVGEVISTGIAIGAALETAHRAGVLHRDIKPANVLITTFDRPVLADFGIAATLERLHTEDADAVGLSVPWAAPELLEGNSSGTVASEVWSLGATLYALLTGRSPFELTDGANDRRALAGRIMGRATPGRLERPDAPPALVDVISASLQKNPQKRPASVLEVLQRLQLAEAQLGLRPSSLELASEAPLPLPQISGAQERGHAGTSTGRLASLAPNANPEDATGRRRRRRVSEATPQFDDATQMHGGGFTRQGRQFKRWQWVVAATAAAVIAAVAVVAWWKPWDTAPGMVSAIEANPEKGAVVFSWSPPQGAVEQYEVHVEGRPVVQQPQNTFRVETTKGGQRVCVTVAVVRAGVVGAASQPRCARSGEGE